MNISENEPLGASEHVALSPEELSDDAFHAVLTTEAILPVEAFEAFKVAVQAPGKKIPGLARAAKATKGILKDAGCS